MRPPRLAVRPPVVDIAVATGVGVLAVATHLLIGGRSEAALVQLPSWVLISCLVVMAVALAWRRAAPAGSLQVVGSLTVVYYVGGGVSPGGVVIVLFSVYAFTAYTESRRDGLVVLAISLFWMTVSIAGGAGPRALLTADYGLSAFTFVVAWSLGDGTRTRRQLAEELADRAAQLEALRTVEQAQLVAAERRRIARELHDVVSHTVSVVVVQAAAARRVLDRDARAVGDALAAIEGTGREAMVELRRMLGLLRDGDGVEHAPAPDLDATRALVASLAGAGMPVVLEGELADPDAVALPPGVALTVHRIIQEGLANVLRHTADVGEVRVSLRRASGRVHVAVVDDGRPRGFTAGAGTGLVGLRERVALDGGVLVAEPLPARGFRLAASLPVDGTSPGDVVAATEARA